MKRCTKCKQFKDESEFNKNKNSKDGLQSYCRVCDNEANKQHRIANSEKINERSRKYHEDNSEHYKQYFKQYRQSPGGKATRARASAKRRALEKSVENTLSEYELQTLEKAQEFRCCACGASIIDGYHIDHIFPVSKGGGLTIDNVQLLCPHCNMSKKDKTIDYLLNYLFTGQFINQE